MARTVKVGLDVDERPYVAGMGRAEQATGKIEDALDDVADSAKDTTASTERAKESVEDLGDSATDAGRDLNRLRDDAARLDRQINETNRSIRDLAREIARTSDEAERAKLSEKLTGEQGRLRDQVNLRKLIDFSEAGPAASGIGAMLAEMVAGTFASSLGPALSRAPMAGMNPAVAAIAAPLAVGLAATVGAAVSGAVVGGAAGIGIVGGIKVAAKHPDVQASAKATGDTISEVLKRSAVSFVPATVDALGDVRAEVRGMGDDLERAFSASSSFVKPLTAGGLAGAKRAVEGFATAVERAGPVVNAVANIAERAGDVIGDSFEGMSEHAHEGARALTLLWGIFEFGVRSIMGTIEGLTIAYGLMDKFGALLTFDIERLVAMEAAERTATDAGGGLSDGLRELLAGFDETGDAAGEAAIEVQSLRDRIQELTDKNFAARAASRDLQAAIDDATAAVKENGRTLDESTPKGRANAAALDAIALKANAAYQASLDLGEGQEAANGKLATGRAAFLKLADAMGMDATQAKILADRLFAIPSVKPTVTVQQQQALSAISAVQQSLGKLPRSKTINVGVYYTTKGDLKLPGGTQLKNRWGGVYEHAQVGVLREAQIAAPVAPARYAWAEPATGGEAFIPRFGNPQRSLAILDRAAGWYGQTVTPLSALRPAAGRSTTVVNTYQLTLAPGVVGSRMELETWLAGALDSLRRQGRTS